jgi:hypothetical protein
MKVKICDNCKKIMKLGDYIIKINLQTVCSLGASNDNYDFCCKECLLNFFKKYRW